MCNFNSSFTPPGQDKQWRRVDLQGAYAPGRQQRGTERGWVFFCNMKYTKILLALLKQGWAWKSKPCA